MSGNRDERDDGNPIQGLVAALAILAVGVIAAVVGMNIGDWL